MLKIQNLTKVYKGGKVAVDNLSLTVEKGDIFAFIGHNGAGKSTTIKSCVGLLDFTDGDVLIDGVSISKDPLYCKSVIAYIPDNPDIYEYMTGIGYLNFIADVFKVDKTERLELIDKYATSFEIKQNLGDLIGSYSHGMKQKIVIIAALLHKPKLMIMDEPFVGLDPKASFILKTMMTEMCKEGMAIFFSTHVLEVAEKLCNKVAIIKDGKLIVSGNTDEIVKDKSLENVFMDSADYNGQVEAKGGNNE